MLVIFLFQKEDLDLPHSVYGQFQSNESVCLQRNGRKQGKVKVSLKIKIKKNSYMQQLNVMQDFL